MTKRERIIMREVLRVLSETPANYKEPQDALCAQLQLCVVPPPTGEELDNVLARLEADCLIVCAATILSGKAWRITGQGRAALAET